MMDDVIFFAKKHIIHLDNDLQQSQIIVFMNFQGSNFNLYYIYVPRFTHILYMFRCDVQHLMN